LVLISRKENIMSAEDSFGALPPAAEAGAQALQASEVPRAAQELGPFTAYGEISIADAGTIVGATLDGRRSGPDGNENYHS
jgi:hypothetical protein